LKVTFLGTGTSQGVPVIGCTCDVCQSSDARDKRLRCSVHIEVDDLSIVIDSGPDFRQQMLRQNIKSLDAVIITHEHNDHIIGLDDIRAFNFLQKSDIPLYAEQRVIDDLSTRFNYIFSNRHYPGIPKVSTHPIVANRVFKIEQTELLPIRVMHGTLPVIGFRINDFCYITDANYIDDTSRELIKGTRVIVLNALRHTRHHSHFNVEEAVSISSELGVEMTYLTHISHHMGLTKEWEALLPSKVNPAHDGLVLNM